MAVQYNRDDKQNFELTKTMNGRWSVGYRSEVQYLVDAAPSLIHILHYYMTEREEVREAMLDKSEGEAWIVKPASLACGRGISITNNFADMPGSNLSCVAPFQHIRKT